MAKQPTEKQLKAMRIFQAVLELILGLFKSHHGQQLEAAGNANATQQSCYANEN